MRKRDKGSVFLIALIVFLIIIIVVLLVYFLLGQNKVVNCKTPECFEENFNKCSSAKMETFYDKDTYSYLEILGEENGNCLLKQVLSTPQTGELEMTCKFDSSLTLREFSLMYDENENRNPVNTDVQCEGSLYDYQQQLREIGVN